MTPIQLVIDLSKCIENVVKDYRMEESDNREVMRAPKIWLQSLPEKLYDGEPDPADYPLVLILLDGGPVVEDELTFGISITVAGYDDGQVIEGGVRDRQGWTIPASMAWRIIAYLSKNRTIGAAKMDITSLSWDLPADEQPVPQWYGTVYTTWSIPLPQPNYDLGNMNLYTNPPCDAALVENIHT